MAINKIGVSVALDGEKEFKQSVKNINTEMTVLGSEMKKVTAQYADNSTSMDALRAKQDVLSRTTETQKTKVELLKNALESAKKEYGDSSDKVQSWQIKLNNAEATLAKTESQLKQTTNDINNFGKEAQNASEKTGLFKTVFTASFWSNFANNVLSSIVSGIKSLASSALQAADNLEQLTSTTGISISELQKMTYVGDDLKVSVDTQAGALKRLINNMEAAQAGSGTAYDAFKKLNVQYEDGNKQLLSSNDVYSSLIDSLGKVANETERDALAQDLFGKSATDLNPLIEAGSAEIKKLGDEAEKTGAVMSDDAVNALDSTGDALDHVKQRATALVGEGLAAIISSTDDAADKFDKLSESMTTSDNTLSLISKYRELSGELRNSSLTEEQLSEKTSELEKVKQDLITASNGVVTALNIENGTFETQIAALEKMTQAQKDNLKYQLIAEALKIQDAGSAESQAAAQNKVEAAQANYTKALLDTANTQKELNDNVSKGGVNLNFLTGAESQSAGQAEILKKQFASASSEMAETSQKSVEFKSKLQALVKDGLVTADEACAYFKLTNEELTAILADNSDATDDNADSKKNNTDTTADLTATLKTNEDATKSLSSAVDTASSAFKEQAESGSLSLNTILSLIDAGYAGALATDAGTGAVTLNRSAYIALTQSKIADQIATLQATVSSLNAKIALENEAAAAAKASGDYALLAGSKAISSKADTESLESVKAQIAGLSSLSASLSKTVTSYTKYSGGASSSATKVKTAAEKASDAFNTAVEDIDHELSVGLISEEEYWKQYTDLMASNLQVGSDAWKKADEKLYKANQSTYKDIFSDLENQYEDGETDLKTFISKSETARDKYLRKNTTEWKTAYSDMFDEISKIETSRLNDIKDNYDKSLSDIQGKIDSMQSSLLSVGDITETVKVDDTDITTLSNLDAQTASITSFGDALEALKKRGISADMLSKIAGMDVAEGTTTANLLLGLSDSDWKKELDAWDAKQKAAKLIAEAYYADDVKTLNDTLTTAVTGLQTDMTAAGLDLGGNAINGVVKGIQDGTINVENAMSGMIESAFNAAKKTAQIASPSKRGKKEIGLMMPYGVAGGIEEGTPVAVNSMATMTEKIIARAKSLSGTKYSMGSLSSGAASDSSNAANASISEGLVNGLSAVMGNSPVSGGTYTIQCVLKDGRVLAEAVYDPLKQIAKQKGD